MPNAADVLILGGGVIGLTTAYALARAGARAAVLDRQEFGREASWAGAGIIPPGNPEGATTPYDLLRALSAKRYPGLAAELREITDIDSGYRRCGGLELDDAAVTIEVDAWTAEGVLWERFSGNAVRMLEPALARSIDAAYFLPDMAQVRNPRLLRALVAANKELGVELTAGCRVDALEYSGSSVSAAVTASGRWLARDYLVCAGAWTDELLGSVCRRTGVRPVRGQMVLLHARSPGPERILLRGTQYIVPRGDGRVLVGSTEEESGFDKTTTASAIADLIRFATDLVPALAEAAVEQCWAGLRPGSPDGLPVLGRLPGYDNLWVATGHYRAGIQLAPATAQVLADAILGRPTSFPLHAFRPDRRPMPPARVAFRS